MSYVVDTIYYALAQIPGLAARTHLPCGRMGMRLRYVMLASGVLVAAGGAMCGIRAYRGFTDGAFGYFLAGAVMALAAFLLLGGSHAVARAAKNPAPASAANVIPFHRPVDYPAPDLHRYRRRDPNASRPAR